MNFLADESVDWWYGGWAMMGTKCCMLPGISDEKVLAAAQP